jgi:transglutaminase-like putative cysteine protease
MTGSMIYDVRHATSIHYGGPARLARFNLRLKPAPWPGQTLHQYQLSVDPPPATLSETSGPWIVNCARLGLVAPIERLDITSSFRIEVATAGRQLDFDGGPRLVALRDSALARPDLSALGPANYLFDSPITGRHSEIADWAAPMLPPDGAVLECIGRLMAAVHDEFHYDSTATHAQTPPIDAFRQRTGVCQDFAHVMIIAARAHGIPAAYVSGYLRTEPPPGQPRLVGADAMHAWVNIWCGDTLGWVGFDPTNGTTAGADHIFVAMGRDFADVSPLDGVFHGGGDQMMTVAVDVVPVADAAVETPLPT